MASVRKDLDEIAARIASNSGAVNRGAQKVLAAARATAAAHSHTGEYMSHFGVEHGRKDTIVYNDDPAALAIEFGHTTPDGERVPGQHIMIEARRRAG